MIDPDKHVTDVQTGFVVDKETGHPIGLVPPPIPRVDHDDEWPKWVEPHASHVVRKQTDGAPPSISVLGSFSEFHVNRIDGAVTVLVRNEDEEKEAIGELKREDDRPVVTSGESDLLGETFDAGGNAGDRRDPPLAHFEPGTGYVESDDEPKPVSIGMQADGLQEPKGVHPYDGAPLTATKAIEGDPKANS